MADAAFVEDTLALFAGEGMTAVVAELYRILHPSGRLCISTMEREYTEGTAFVRGYDWAFDHLPRFERFGRAPSTPWTRWKRADSTSNDGSDTADGTSVRSISSSPLQAETTVERT